MIQAKKSLGQNFLTDEIILQKIANTVNVTDQDLIIEIGPGKGALTKYLVQKNCFFLAYEIDERMKPILKKYEKNIIFDDFLKRNIKEDINKITYQNLYVIANIPYYITTPIIEHLISSQLSFNKIVLLVQKEVAHRFSAKPNSKNYGFFTVLLNCYFQVELLFDVPRNAFSPAPNVDSAVVCFMKKDQESFMSKEYLSFLKKCFSKKRKTLKNNLKEYDWNFILPIIKKYDFNESVRAEEISENILKEIFLALHK